ncbi:MAG: SH3 domain-containing protein [Ruminococcus sp.]|nr:SH3 domain-containing protein [Ruminococcus sp.]
MDSNKSSGQKFTLVHLLLIAVIILMAVIIAFMSTSMRAILDDDKQTSENSDSGGDMNIIITTEYTTENEEYVETTTSELISTAIQTIIQKSTTTTTTAQVTEKIITITTTTEPAFTKYEYKINNIGVIVYEKADPNSKPIDYINDKGTYTIVDEFQNWGKLQSGGWIKFDIAEQSGGVSYLGIGKVVTKKDPLNLRIAPDIDAKIINTIPKGDSVGIYESEYADWYLADYNGQTGFVNAEFISFEDFTMVSPESYTEPNTYTDINTDRDNYYYFGTGWVATERDPLNLRSEPSKDAPVLTTIPKGTALDLYMSSVDESKWFYVTYNGVSGYITTEYIDAIGQHNNTVKTNGSDLYLRDSASKNGNVLAEMPDGTRINIIEYNDDWCYIEYNGIKGYASTEYLTF